MGLICSIYQFSDILEKPIVSRQGTKGGRFIDGTYTCLEGLAKDTDITIIRDYCVSSDHDLVISKIDLGLQQFQISKKRINFRQIMTIPVRILPGADHPSLNDSVYKGADYQLQVEFYTSIQDAIKDPDSNFLVRIPQLSTQLKAHEIVVVQRTKNEITLDDQVAGKLIQRTALDADWLNSYSSEFFILNDICWAVDLASKVTILPSASTAAKKSLINQGKLIPLSKHLDEAVKRSCSAMQRLQLLIKALTRPEVKLSKTRLKEKWAAHVQRNLADF